MMVKRDSAYRPRGIDGVWPMFYWLLCKKCGKEFRREGGWQKHVGPFYGNVGNWVYVCAECCPTAAKAEMAFNDHGIKPPPPPAPPRKTGWPIPQD